MYPSSKKDFKENPMRRVYKNSKCASKRKEKRKEAGVRKIAVPPVDTPRWLTRSNGFRKRSVAVDDKRK